MKAIIIAAGAGKRLAPLTDQMPKCLLPVGDTTMLANTLDILHQHRIDQIAIVVGYCKEKFQIPDVQYFVNTNYHRNNILHSLMSAQNFMDDDVLITYADTWLEARVIKDLIHTKGDLVVGIDLDWEQSYAQRPDNPIQDAEMALLDEQNNIQMIGKNIFRQEKAPKQSVVGEFMGLVKVSKNIIGQFTAIFNQLNQQMALSASSSQQAKWQNAYLADFLNLLLKQDFVITSSCHHGGWMEVDTMQDYEILLDKVSAIETLKMTKNKRI